VSKVSYNVDERGIAVMKINNPPMNALDEQVMFEMEDCARRIPFDEKVKVVIVTGEGPTFVVGADINKVSEVDTVEKGIDATSKAHAILNLIENSRKPYIAAVNGLCLGGGTELALACHLRIAGDQAQMGLPEIMLGIMPGFGGTQRSARLLGTARALEIMLTGKFIDMKEAEHLGLVNRVVPNNEVLDEAMKLAKSISFKGQVAVRAIVEAVMEGVKLPLDDGLALESRLFGRLAESEDKKEGIKAFFEKRKPVFKDR
jgi:enoyl-CoA hydratase